MNVSNRSLGVQMHRLILYQRGLHPELFELQDRRTEKREDYEAELWLSRGGHVVRFQVEDQTLCETVIGGGEHLPETGLLHALPCFGERDYELEEPPDEVGYMTTVQTEQLSENLYAATRRELETFAEESDALIHNWTDAEGGSCLSVIDTQKYKREFHVQTYHLLADAGHVLRTQSIFELLA